MTFADNVQELLHRAFIGARNAGHATVTPEHIALELIRETETAAYLSRRGTNLSLAESKLRQHLDGVELLSGNDLETKSTAAFQRVIQTAIQQTQADHREYLVLRDLFLAVLDEQSSVASAAILEATDEPRVFEELRTYRFERERGAV